MKKYRTTGTLRFILFSLLTIILIPSCKKHNDPDLQPPPHIRSFTPSTAAKDSLIVINGDNFNPYPTGNVVTFNGVPATVVNATPTSLTVRVPLHAKDGKITVMVGTETDTSADDFTYIYTVSTLAGGRFGFRDGADTTAQFGGAFGVTRDGAGNIIVADGGNNRIRKITPDGMVSTIAGDGTIGSRNGAAAQAQFNNPRGVAVDAAGNIYVADASNNLIRKITPDGKVSTLAGDGTNGLRDAPGSTARFSFPVELVLDGTGNIFVTDGGNRRIRKIDPAGMVSTFGTAVFSFPEGITRDSEGNLYIADAGGSVIYKMNQAGNTTIVAGTGFIGHKDGPATIAQFTNPEGITIDAAGNLYVGDLGNEVVRKITPAGLVSTLVGSTTPGFANGPGSMARFTQPSGITVSINGDLFLADAFNFRICKIQ